MLFTEEIYKSTTPFEWVSQHIQLVGWPAVVSATLYITWKVRGLIDTGLDQLKQAQGKTAETLAAVNIVKADVQTMSSNHLSHIEKDMADLNKKHDQSIEVLQSIDRGIAVLVDRGNRKKANRG